MADTTLIGKLISKVDGIRGRLNTKTGLRKFRVFRVIRTWSGGEVGDGSVTSSEIEILPIPDVVFETSQSEERHDVLERGRVEEARCTLKETSLTYTEAQLTGQPLAAGAECYYRLVGLYDQAATTTYWVLDGTPTVDRDNFQWLINLRRAVVME